MYKEKFDLNCALKKNTSHMTILADHNKSVEWSLEGSAKYSLLITAFILSLNLNKMTQI